jgi:autotransporter-associated beta strand protein
VSTFIQSKLLSKKRLALLLASTMLGASPVAAQTIGNTATNGSISNFGNPDTQTYGQVFTAPISGELESFTLNLNAGVGSIMGGVGTWNGSPTWRRGFGSPINLYLSSPVASSVGGAYTFTPNISLVAGNMYVAYVSVYGLNLSGNVFSQMPRGSSASGLNYFVWHNSSAGGTPDPIGNPSWNYFSNLGNVLFSASIVNNSYFDGAGPSSDGIVQGGAGQWDNATLNWTNDIGTSSGVYRDGYTNLITFGGNNGGVVNVSGTRQFGILSFAVDGYLLTGSGTLAINNATISVGDGLTATISNIISGVNGLTKSGAGTLTLTGANSYTGGTLVSAGRLTGNTTSLQGAIVNNALVEFAQVSAGTYAGAMSGTGGLTKTGAGTLTLTGANSYSGGTLVSAGRLTGDTTSLQGAITNNAVVEFAQVSAGTYAGAMSGTGSLTKTGAGTLTLTGANSYTGGTLVSAGRLTGDTTSLQGAITNNAVVEFAQVSAGTYAGGMSGTGSLTKTGAGTLTLTGANSYTGGTLVSAGRLTGNTTSLQGAIVNNAAVEFAQSTAGAYAGNMSGTGGLTKTGASTLTLTGANSYTGGTLVSAGRLTGDTTSLQGAIVNNAAVEFAQSTSGTYAGAMSGTGGLTKTGGGTLTLTGANSYTGGTLVSAGRLTGNTTSLQGAIVNNAEVEFAQSTAGAYAGNMAGSGAFYKSGVGSLALGGITSITGAANIIAGRLNITGQLTAASVTVQNAATLSGNGVIAGNVTVQSGGSLAPGESAGTLSVVGNVSFLTGSNFGVEIDGRTYNPVGGAGSYDLLRISGVANLGGTIAPTLRGITGAATNNYVPSIGDSFLVLSAGTVVGNFSSVVQPASGLPVGGRFDAIYGGDFVRLVVTPSSFAALANAQNWIGNGSSAARGIDNIRLAAGVRSGASQTLFNGLYGMNAAQLQSTFSQISGEIYANSLQSVTETERSTFSSIFNASCDVSCGMPDGEAGTNRSIWGRYIGKYANHDGDQSASGYNSSSKGLAVGATLTDSNYLQFGVAASYVENEVSMPLGASSNTNATAGYLYLHYTPSDNFNFSSVLGVSLADTQVMRSIGTTGGKVSVNSEKQSMTILYGTKVSYRNFLNGPLSLWTDAGLELSDTSLGRVSERAVNSDFALLLDKVNRRSAETQMSARLQLVSDDAQISLSAGWVYELGDDPSALRKVELGDANWTVRSVDKQRHGIRLGMQSRAQLSKRISLSAMYQHTNQGNGYTYDRANVGLNFAF